MDIGQKEKLSKEKHAASRNAIKEWKVININPLKKDQEEDLVDKLW